MPVTYRQTNFTAGELSPRMLGRFDLDKYGNGAKELENVVPVIQGGVRSTEGTEFIAEVKDSTKKTRLTRFVFSKTEALMLEFGHQYIRFFDQDGSAIMDGGSPYEIATPFTESQLFEIEFTSKADTIFMLHEAVFPQRLQRIADDNWVIEDTPFIAMPFDELGTTLSAVLTLSDATVGTGRTITASAGVFLEGDVDRSITYIGGEALITAFASSTSITVEVKSAFASVTLPTDAWTLEGSPQLSCKANLAEPVGKDITLVLTKETFTWNGGGAGIPTYVDVPANGFRSNDVGKHVEINGGLVEITAFNSASTVSGKIKRKLSSPVAAVKNSWSLKASIWSATLGYPRCGTFYEQRLILAGSTQYPNSWAASGIGLYLDFTLGIEDDDAILYELATTNYSPILHASRKKKHLILFTTSGEYLVGGGVEKALTPTNVAVDDPTDYGCGDASPIRVGKDVCYVQRGDRKLRAMSYRFEDDQFGSPDLTKLAEHITGTGIIDMAFQQEPDSLVWTIRKDGKMAVMAIDRDENVVSWCTQSTDGEFEAVAVIPGDDLSDNVWVVVKRTVGGVTKRFIERFNIAFPQLHSAVQFNLGTPGKVVSGLDHLEGRTVEIIGDDIFYGQFTVTAGAITLLKDVTSGQIGLPPLQRAKIVTLTPEIVGQTGSSQGNPIGRGEINIKVLDTYGININGEYIDKRKHDMSLLDQPVPKITADLAVQGYGWEKTQEITIEAGSPQPIHVLAVIFNYTVGRIE